MPTALELRLSPLVRCWRRRREPEVVVDLSSAGLRRLRQPCLPLEWAAAPPLAYREAKPLWRLARLLLRMQQRIARGPHATTIAPAGSPSRQQRRGTPT